MNVEKLTRIFHHSRHEKAAKAGTNAAATRLSQLSQ